MLIHENVNIVSNLVSINQEWYQVLSTRGEILNPQSFPKSTQFHDVKQVLGHCKDGQFTVGAYPRGLPLFYTAKAAAVENPILDDGYGNCLQINKKEWSRHLQSGGLIENIAIQPIIKWRRSSHNSQIPVLSKTFDELNNLHNNTFDSQDVIKIIEKDPIAIAQIKRLASKTINVNKRNSPGVIQIEEAVKNILGPERVRFLLMFISMKRTLLLEYMSDEDVEYYTDTAFMIANNAFMIANEQKKENAKEYFLSGLLCEFSLFVLSEVLRGKFRAFSRTLKLNPLIYTPKLFELMLGQNDYTITSDILSEWQFEETIIDHIRNQYSTNSIIRQSKVNIISNNHPYRLGSI